MAHTPAFVARDMHDRPSAWLRRMAILIAIGIVLAVVWRPICLAVKVQYIRALVYLTPSVLMADVVRHTDPLVPPDRSLFASPVNGYSPYQIRFLWTGLNGDSPHLYIWWPETTFTAPVGTSRWMQLSTSSLAYQHAIYATSAYYDVRTLTPVARYRSAASWLASAGTIRDHDNDGSLEGIVSIDAPDSAQFTPAGNGFSGTFGTLGSAAHCYAVIRYCPDGLDLLAIVYTNPTSYATRPYVRLLDADGDWAVQIVHGFSATHADSEVSHEFRFDHSLGTWRLTEGDPDQYRDVAWLFPTDTEGNLVHVAQDVLLETFILKNYPPPERITNGRRPEDRPQITPSWFQQDK
ncbi:MAG: hypothetical protein D8M59_12740 [Planctomycetes bacterium]|nr:hypothetical protein [Planctomycetota bacterium]NOG53685.1 hypothetical protein [Planctomycetota bacterium]